MTDERPPESLRNYRAWNTFMRLGFWEMTRLRHEASELSYRPLVSILMPVYNPERRWLERALDSVMSQIYPDWELCICEDASTKGYVREVLELYDRLDMRIKVKYLDENTGIVGATNHALSLAGGEFAGMLDHDDELTPNALFEIVRLLQEKPDADLIYSDEDKIDEDGERVQPHFKIGWSQDLAMSANYLNHFSVYRSVLLKELGGWRDGFDGAQDLELVQRYGERTDRIYHIPKVLYHWRQAEGSTAVGADSKPYTHERARQAVKDLLERQGVAASVENGFAPNTFRIEREIIGEPRVSVLIPADQPVSQKLVKSLRSRTSYPNYEVLSVDLKACELARYPVSGEESAPVKLEGSSFSELCNAAIRRAEGEYVLILDPHLEAPSERWLEAMLQHAQRPEVGAVGGCLILQSGKLLHGGLALDEPEASPDRPPRFYRYCTHESVGYRHYYALTRNCSAVSSACLMLRKSVFEETGGFDESHFGQEFADVDLCLRLRESGRLIVYTPYAEFTYQGRLPRYSDLEPAETDYVRERWAYVLDNDPYYNPNLSWQPTDPLARGKKPETTRTDGRQTATLAQPTEAAPSAGASPPPPIPDIKKTAGDSSSEEPERPEALWNPVELPAPFFVVGHGRSGTTWLEQTLNTHPEVLCKGSGMFFGRTIDLFENQRTLPAVLDNSEDLKTWHDMRPNYWSERPFNEDVPGMVRALADHTMGAELRRSGKKIAGDRTPHYVKYLDEVHELYPASKIIHIIRDGRDVAISNLHAVWQNARDRGGPVDLEPEVIQKRDAYLKDREAFLKSGESIFTEHRIKQLARSWKQAVIKGRRDGQRLFGDNYLEVRYEDLLEDSQSQMKRLFEFLGVEQTPEVLDRIIQENSFEKITGRSRGQEDSSVFHRKGVAGDWKEVFTDRDRQTFETTAGDLLAELGYENGGADGPEQEAGAPAKTPAEPSVPLPRSRNSWATIPPFFVVGHGRSGTTWSERLLNSHPEVLCKGSGMFFGRTIGLFEGRKTLYATLANSDELRLWHDMLPNYWGERPFDEDVPGMVKALTDHTLKTALDKSDKRIVGDRTPHYAQFLQEIHELYPASKIIHIIRDGRDVAISNLHAFWNSARDRGGPIDLDSEELERRDAYLEDRESFLKSGESIFTESRIKQLSSSWKRLITRARGDGQRLFGDNYLEIRYERLLDEPRAELERVFEFLAVDRDTRTVDQLIEENSFEKGARGRVRGEEDTTSFFRKGIHGDWKNVFNDRDRRIFKEQTDNLLINLGYEKDMNW